MYNCENCGSKFEDGLYCPKCGVKVGEDAKVCPSCRTKYYTNACPNCGYIYKTSTGTTYPSPPVNSSFSTAPGEEEGLEKILRIVEKVGRYIPEPGPRPRMRSRSISGCLRAIVIIIVIIIAIFILSTFQPFGLLPL